MALSPSPVFLPAEPPQFVKEPERHVTAEMEKVVDIPCRAKGNPAGGMDGGGGARAPTPSASPVSVTDFSEGASSPGSPAEQRASLAVSRHPGNKQAKLPQSLDWEST